MGLGAIFRRMDRSPRFRPLAALGAAVLVAGACSHRVAPDESAVGEPHAVHWAYKGAGGPDHWASLDAANAACADSKKQSPIDIKHASSVNVENIEFHYGPSKLNIINNGHTVQVNYDPGSWIEIAGVRYDLIQFHFHMPSEHEINGKHKDGELHLVHRSADGHFAVVGVILERGDENPAFATVWANLPSLPGPERHLDAQTNAANFLPKGRMTWRYEGSLTTPPCTEGVAWSVMVDPVYMSSGQFVDFMHIIGDNSRPVEPLGDRPLIEDMSP